MNAQPLYLPEDFLRQDLHIDWIGLIDDLRGTEEEDGGLLARQRRERLMQRREGAADGCGGWLAVDLLSLSRRIEKTKTRKRAVGGEGISDEKATRPHPRPLSRERARGDFFDDAAEQGGEERLGNGLLAQADAGSGAGMFVGGRFINPSNQQGFSRRRRFRREYQAN